uniref:Unconventional myosin-Ie n=1 Tax=Lygus hesperus TaxID=30085 RepID=A0A0A9WNJ6_LYGHE
MGTEYENLNGYHFIKSKTSSTIVVPISTRGIGFHSQILFCRAFSVVDVDTPCSVFALYRVSLFQLHYRMTRVRDSKLLFYDDHFCSKPLRHGFCEIVSKLDRNFATLARLISAVGNFELEGVEYTPRFPVLTRTTFPDPVAVNATNLRDVVSALSDVKTDKTVRRYFYDHNPLPCARWSNESDEDFPLLLNPDDFMTSSYDEDFLLDDIAHVNALFGGYSASGTLDVVHYDGLGDPAILVSNRPSHLRIDEIPLENGRPAYEKTSLKGNISTFWSPRKLSPDQLYSGSLYLVGELPEPKSFDMNYALRSPTVQVLQANVNLRTIITRGSL